MTDAFRDIVATLWKELGLSPPRFDRNDAAATLTVDGIALTLAPTEDGGHIAVSATAGKLSANPAAADEQVARLLAANLVTLPSSRACVGLDDRDSPTPTVMVRAFVPCQAAANDWLVKAISDVAYLSPTNMAAP
jgi:hypothetical protein